MQPSNVPDRAGCGMMLTVTGIRWNTAAAQIFNSLLDKPWSRGNNRISVKHWVSGIQAATMETLPRFSPYGAENVSGLVHGAERERVGPVAETD